MRIDNRIFIVELGRDDMLGRNERTIRSWVRDARAMFDALGHVPDGYLPEDLWPTREDSGRRRIFWYEYQLVGLRDFADDKSSSRGWKTKPCSTCGEPKSSDAHKSGACTWVGEAA